MAKNFSSDKFVQFSPPNNQSAPPHEWAKENLENVLEFNRRKIVLFDNFPPEYIDYYKALQEEIAKKIPSEQERPLICLNIRGKNRIHDASPADIGMAGGTGPLSDATAVENLVCLMSDTKHSTLNENREKVAEKMQNFSGVMYSMPPPRDLQHVLNDAIDYRNLYKSSRESLPCKSLHILTNTGHSNKWVFDNSLFFGGKELGDVDDMTVKVAQKIQQHSNPNEKVLILGTIEADKAQLYPNLLNERGVCPVLPTEQYKDKDAKDYLQSIIDQAKAGKVNDPMPNETRSCGQAFVDFAVNYAKETKCQSLLFSCTELPMILHTVDKVSGQTYFEKLKHELSKLPNGNYKFYDSEEIFVEEMAKKSHSLQSNPEMRSTFSTKKSISETEDSLHLKLKRLKAEIEKHRLGMIGKTDEKLVHKRNVLKATLDYFQNGDLGTLKKAMQDNPKYAEASMLWGSTTQAMVNDACAMVDKIRLEKTKAFKAKIEEGRKPADKQVATPQEEPNHLKP